MNDSYKSSGEIPLFDFTKTLFFLSGIFSLFAQVILIREFIAIFYGNELIIGVVTSLWMFSVFLGNRISTHFFKKNITLLTVTLLCMIFVTPFLLLTLKLIASSISTTSHIQAPLKTILISAVLTVAPIGILNGFLFPIGCAIAEKNKDCNALSFYRSETIGLLISGMLFAFFFARNFTNFKSLIILTNAITIAASILSFFHFKNKFKFIFLCVPMLLMLMPSTKTIARYEALSFPNEKLIKSVPSVHGNISVTKNLNQNNFYLNNFYQGCSDDILNSQLSSHLPLVVARNKHTLLYIGSLFDETLSQILTDTAVKKIYIPVEDYRVLDTVTPYLSEAQQRALKDKKVTLIKDNLRSFIKSSDDKFTFALINIGKPETGSANRFYTREFFQVLKKRLTDDGAIVIKFSQQKTYIPPEDAGLLQTIAATLQKTFPYTRNYINDMTLLCASLENILPADSDEAVSNFKKDITPKGYLHSNVVRDLFSQNSEKNFAKAVQSAETKKINTDLTPAAYNFTLQKQVTLYEGQHFLKGLMNISTKGWFVISCILAALFSPRKKADMSLNAAYSMSIISFACMLLLLCLIYSLHAVYGTAYIRISLLSAIFMGGIYRGTTYAQIAVSLPHQNVHTFLLRLIGIKITLMLFTGILCLFFFLSTVFIFPEMLQMVFWLLLAFYLGNFNGYGFGLIKNIRNSISTNGKETSSGIYGAEILGGSIGAFLCGMIFIPKFGIYQTCLIAVSFVFFSFIFTFTGHKYLKNP